jgi:hypothetical protein
MARGKEHTLEQISLWCLESSIYQSEVVNRSFLIF